MTEDSSVKARFRHLRNVWFLHVMRNSQPYLFARSAALILSVLIAHSASAQVTDMRIDALANQFVEQLLEKVKTDGVGEYEMLDKINIRMDIGHLIESFRSIGFDVYTGPDEALRSVVCGASSLPPHELIVAFGRVGFIVKRRLQFEATFDDECLVTSLVGIGFPVRLVP